MKTVFKIFFITLLGIFTSCETTELDLRDNPNQISPNQADVEFLYNSIQINFGGFVNSLGNTSGQVVRINYMFGRNYQNAYSPQQFDFRWTQAYQRIFSAINVLEPLAIEQEKFIHLGQSQVIKAYILITLVDMFGDVPLSQAGQPDVFPNPIADPGEDVYAVALDLLDQALSNLNSSSSPGPDVDLMYGENSTNWVKAANSIKLKALLQTRLVDASAIGKFNAIISSGNYIQNSSQDFQFNWGLNPVDPGVSSHPRYLTDYTPSGPGSYRSTSLMNSMVGADKEDPADDDPRIRYYFYRQKGETPGLGGVPPNGSSLPCSIEDKPDHYSSENAFCALPNGYWGRDHGDEDGIPPDNSSRTIIGVYPAGGIVDANQFSTASSDRGARGLGITPLLLASTVDFYRAEVALFITGNTGTARGFITDGISKSVAKTQSFQSRDTDLTPDDITFLSANIQSTSAFISSVENAYNGAGEEGKKDILANQFFINLYGNSLDAYAFYRRTGYPKNIQPNLEGDPGGFIRSFFYPANEANTNQNINQKPNQKQQVFWDDNPGSPGFPTGN